MHSLYDSITHRWVYVPITLVIDMKSEYITELLEEMQNKDDDDSDEIDPENDEYTL